MAELISFLEVRGLAVPLRDDEATLVARELSVESGLAVYSESIAVANGRVYFLGRHDRGKFLGILALREPAEFEGEVRSARRGVLKLCPPSRQNAASLRNALPYTAPVRAGEAHTFGMGDRLGLATPAHIRAIRGTGIMPILAQQSVREMMRSGRSPEQVLDDATWGVFQEGFRDGYGADADHLKIVESINQMLAAGFRMFTVDAGDYVDNRASRDDAQTFERRLPELPWDDLEARRGDCVKTFAGKIFAMDQSLQVEFTEKDVLRAALKYGRAVAHTTRLYRHLAQASAGRPFDFEVSLDETDSPTSIHEHIYVAHELRRLGVKVGSLAPRFVGDFEKGVDYKGDLTAFEDSFAKHVKVAKEFGPYKISVHSGSDKFDIYPIIARQGGALAHVKTAGTSYLEALRAVSCLDAGMFREILAFTMERYREDRGSYFVSAKPEKIGDPAALSDTRLRKLLDEDDARQVLHVTFGSVLASRNNSGGYRFRDRLLDLLRDNEEAHYETVARHLRHHIEALRPPLPA